MKNKQRLILKVSGGALSGETNDIHDYKSLRKLVVQLKKMSEDFSVSVVIGGGNIWRGDEKTWINQTHSHYIGMLSTVINGMVLSELLNQENAPTDLYSSINVNNLTLPCSLKSIEKSFKGNNIIVFAGGTGIPYITTDMCVVMKAIEHNIKTILIGKDGVDGIYEKDPKIHKDAKRFTEISYDEVLDLGVTVMDIVSFRMAQKHGLELIVFNQLSDNAFIDGSQRKGLFTVVK